jgi:Lysine 2,3-aminomutase
LRPGLQALREAGVILLNQSVLLRGVNDDTAILAELSETLFDHGILPYYLHLLDPVAGSAHFAIADEKARALHRQLRAQLPGYLLPRLVREVPGEPSKRSMETP